MPIDSTARGQADILLKLPRRSGPPLAPGKTSAPGSSLGEDRQMLAEHRNDRRGNADDPPSGL